MNGSIDATALMNADWMNPGASVSQPVSTPPMSFVPATSMAPLSAISPQSLNFGQGLANIQASNNPLAYNMNGQLPQGVTPAATPQQGWMGKTADWLGNGNNLGTVVQGLGSLTQAYLGFKQLSMAKDQLRFQKDAFNKNFANSQQTYNTSLEDRIRGRTSAYEGKENDVQSYLSKHKLGG